MGSRMPDSLTRPRGYHVTAVDRLARLTPRTRTDPTWINADLRRIRVRGHLLTTDEVTEGGVTIAAPVRDQSGEVIAALFIASSALRLSVQRA